MKFLITLTFMFSFSAFASYECSFRISNEDDFSIVETEKIFLIDEDEFSSKSIELLSLEANEEGNRTLTLDALFIGWPGEEQISFTVVRKTEGSENSEEILSPRISQTGNGEQSVWAESHKIDFDCSVI